MRRKAGSSTWLWGAVQLLGFDFRQVRSRQGVWRAWYPPKLKKRTALLRKLKEIFRRYQSQPIDRVIALINPILRGWVRYFAVGDASRCWFYQRLGGEEGPTASDACTEATGLRLEEVE